MKQDHLFCGKELFIINHGSCSIATWYIISAYVCSYSRHMQCLTWVYTPTKSKDINFF